MKTGMMRAFATVAGGTGFSRILGFVRDQLLGAVVGPGVVLDAWFAAFTIPNMFRRTFAEGAMANAFVPLLRGQLQIEGEAQARAFARACFTALMLILAPLILVMVFAMPWIIDWLTSFERGSQAYELSVIFGRIMIPYLLFMSAMAFVGGILDALGRFGPKAFAPAMLNVVLVGVLAAVALFDLAPGPWLSWATLIAGIAQLIFVWIPAAQMGWAPTLVAPRGAGIFLQKMVPGIISSGGGQISALIVLVLASSAQGDLSHLRFADRLYQLPLGLIGIALTTVLLSSLSDLIGRGELRMANNQVNRGLELSLLLSVPVALACVFVPDILFAGLFQVGRFTPADTAAASLALAGFAIGIPAAVGQKVLQPVFFARQNTQAPMYHSLAAVAVAVVLSFALHPQLGIFGLAIATSVASWTGFISLAIHLSLRGLYRADARLGVRLLPIFGSGIVMILALEALVWLAGGSFDVRFALRLPLTLGFIGVGGLVYFLAAFGLRATSRADLQNLLGRT